MLHPLKKMQRISEFPDGLQHSLDYSETAMTSSSPLHVISGWAESVTPHQCLCVVVLLAREITPSMMKYRVMSGGRVVRLTIECLTVL